MKFIIIFFLFLSISGCNPEIEQKRFEKEIEMQAAEHKHKEIMAKERGAHERLMRDKTLAFLEPVLKFFLFFAGLFLLISYIAKQNLIKDVRIAEIKEENETKRRAIKSILENIDKLSEKERKALLENKGILNSTKDLPRISKD